MLREKEIEAILALPAPKRYEHGIKMIADREEVWSLRDKKGWVASQTSGGIHLFSIWPRSEYAEICAVGEWAGNKPEKIDLDLWMSEWMPNLKIEGMQIAFFTTPEGKAIEVPIEMLEADLLAELEQYE